MTNRMLKIAVLTGKRGGFGSLIPLFELADADPEIDLTVIATDMHLSDKFGRTIAEVEKWVKNIAIVPMDQKDGSASGRTRALGAVVTGMADTLTEIAPDVLLVLGDRGEILATVMAAIHLKIPVAHIQGGDISGNVDEMMRHAITKMSHIHFPSTSDSAERIRKMGESEKNIYIVGDPHIDCIVEGRYSSQDIINKKFSLNNYNEYAIVLYHPETLGDISVSGRNMRLILDALRERHIRTLMVYPCSDHGYEDIISVIEEFDDGKIMTAHKNIEAMDFWGLQARAKVLVGNSSAGLIEAPYFSLPVVNVGGRQQGRLRWKNVISIGVSKDELDYALEKAFSTEFRESLSDRSDIPFGDGGSCKKIVEILKSVNIDNDFLNKRMSY